MSRSIVLLVLVAGCFPRLTPGNSETGSADTDTDSDADSDTDSDTDTDTDTDPGSARIRSISPADGSTAGGTEVTISGSGFNADTRVWFGSTEADIRDQESDKLVVDAPAHARGEVDVSVGEGSTADTEADAFTFWTDASGQVEAVVLWSYLEDYLGDGQVYGLAYPTVRGDFAFYELWGANLDTCDGVSPIETTTWGDDVYVLDEDGGTYTLALEGSGYSYSDSSGAAYGGVESFGFGGPFSSAGPAFELAPFFDTPNAFDVTRPDLSAGDDSFYSGFNLDVAWSGAGGDFMLVWMVGLDSNEYLYCIAEDDGSFAVDSSYVSRFEYGEYVQLSVARFRTSEATLPHDNGRVIGAGMYQFTGYVTAY